MSRHSYAVSRQLLSNDPPFSAFIFAAMRKADTANAGRLQLAFPELWDELWTRYHSPGGLLPGEEGFVFTEWEGDPNSLAGVDNSALSTIASAADAEIQRRAKQMIVDVVRSLRPGMPEGTTITFGAEEFDNGHFYTVYSMRHKVPGGYRLDFAWTEEEFNTLYDRLGSPLADLSWDAGSMSELSIVVGEERP